MKHHRLPPHQALVNHTVLKGISKVKKGIRPTDLLLKQHSEVGMHMWVLAAEVDSLTIRLLKWMGVQGPGL